MDVSKNETSHGEDEFFGSQDDFERGSSLRIGEFGNMNEHEIDAKRNELKHVGFLDAYDEFKESRMQEGFERGFLDSFAAGKIIGKIIGEATTLEKIYEQQSEDQSANSHCASCKPVRSGKVELIRDYFTNKFQKDLDSNNGKQGLRNLISKTEEYPTTGDFT